MQKNSLELLYNIATTNVNLFYAPLSVLGVSSHRFLRTDPLSPDRSGVSRPGVAWAGVASHIRVLGVAPGVSLPFA